jgi:hypothetical protein
MQKNRKIESLERASGRSAAATKEIYIRHPLVAMQFEIWILKAYPVFF